MVFAVLLRGLRKKARGREVSMKSLFLIGGAVIIAGLLAGCGHNAIQYGDGIGFDAGINPENWTASFTLRYGKILSAVTRDNVEIEVSGKADANGSTGTEKSGLSSIVTDGTLRVRIGRQINGAAVDAIKAGANADRVIAALAEDRGSQFPEAVVPSSKSDEENPAKQP